MKFKPFLLIIALTLLSRHADASTCVLVDVNGFLVNSGVAVDQCNDLVLLDATEYNSINVDSIITTLIDLFEFSAEDFAAFTGACMVVFIVGHSTGRVARILGK